jgi:hypothetical protein
MSKEEIVYSITNLDILKVSEDSEINFDVKDLPFLQDKIGDYMGSIWYEAVAFALTELDARKKSTPSV